MDIKRGVSLSNYSTMGLGGSAQFLCDIESKEDLIEALNYANLNRLKTLMIGSGSNIVWQDSGFDGLVLVNKIRGFEVESEDDQGADVLIGAGEEWDLVVDRSVSLGLSGIEALSLIPGTAGATPVQNVGAYGQEISQTLISVDAYDMKTQSFLSLDNSQCEFSYRHSYFKNEPGRYLILSIRLHLKKSYLAKPLYKVLEEYLDDNNINDTSPKSIRTAVINIRNRKLPDPKVIKNCGSFFHNPIISNEELAILKKTYSDIPSWEVKGGRVKVPAAWLLERAGFKSIYDEDSGIATWEKQPLVLVNKSAKTTGDLLRFRDKITSKVKEMFGITLVQEPELLP